MTRQRIVTAAITLVLVVTSTQMGHTQGFTPASLNGSYGFSASGTLRGGAAAVVGLNTFDGRGNCTISARLTSALLAPTGVTLIASRCTYTVNAAGFGAMEITIPGFPVFSSVFVITGDELRFSLSDAEGGTVASGVSKRMP